MKKSIKNTLKESLVFEIINQMLDEEYPSSFDFKKFISLKSFNKRVNYCEETLKRISSGSSRIVYMVDDTKVLKLAKNKKGLAQNEVEASYSRYNDLRDILAQTFEFDEQNYLWVEMELARKVTPSIFKQVTGYSFENFCDLLRVYNDAVNPSKYTHGHKLPEDFVQASWEDEFMYDVYQYLGNYDVPVGDLLRLSSYGLVKRDGVDTIVLIDYGINNETFASYYS
jgi:hypothetical protein